MSKNDYLHIIRDAKIVSKQGGNPFVFELSQGMNGALTTDGKIAVLFGRYDLIYTY